MLQNPHNRAFRTASSSLAVNDNLHPISVKGSSRPVGRNKDVLLLSLNSHKAKASGIAGKYSHQGEGLCLSELALFRYADFSLCQKEIQHLL